MPINNNKTTKYVNNGDKHLCRIIATHAYNLRGLQILQQLIVALVKAAKYDPLMPSKKKQHCDGYGYVLLYRKRTGSGWRLKYERFDAFTIGEEKINPCIVNLEELERSTNRIINLLMNSNEAYIIIHTRKASPKTPRGTLYAHPYHASFINSIGEHVELFLAHNGYVNIESIAGILGYSTMPQVTDSYLATIYIAEGLKRGEDIQKLLEEISSFTVTAFATGVLVLRDNHLPELYYSNRVVKNPEYYSLKRIRGDGINAVVSPSILYYLESINNAELDIVTAPHVGRLA